MAIWLIEFTGFGGLRIVIDDSTKVKELIQELKSIFAGLEIGRIPYSEFDVGRSQPFRPLRGVFIKPPVLRVVGDFVRK